VSWSSWTTLWGLDHDVILTADCVFFAQGSTLADLADDLSQNLTDLTVGAGGVSEASSSRFLQNDERTIEVRFFATDADDGYFWSYGGQRLTLTAGGTFNAVVNSSTVLALDATSLFSASNDNYLVSWSLRTNPGGSGSTEYLTEVNVWNLTSGGAPVKGTATHTAVSQALTTTVLWARTGGGGDAFTGDREAFRFCVAWHSATESYESMAAQTSAPTLSGEERAEVLVPPVSTTIGDDVQYAGPVSLTAFAAAEANDLRLAGPLLNTVFRTRDTHFGGVSGDSAVTIENPDNAGSYLFLQWCSEPIPVPPKCNRVQVYAFVQQWRTTGDADRVIWSALSMGAPGPDSEPPTSPDGFTYRRAMITRVADDGSGADDGAWIQFDTMQAVRDADSCTYICIAVEVTDNGGSGATTDQRYTLKALVVEPIFDPSSTTIPAQGD